MSDKNPELVKIAYALLGDHYDVFLSGYCKFQTNLDDASSKAKKTLNSTIGIFARKQGQDDFEKNSLVVYDTHRNICFLIMIDDSSNSIVEINKQGDIKIHRNYRNTTDILCGITKLSAPIVNLLIDEINMFDCLSQMIDLGFDGLNVNIEKSENEINLSLLPKGDLKESYLKLTVNPDTDEVTIERKHITDVTKLEYQSTTKNLLELHKEIFVLGAIAQEKEHDYD